eukprot:2501662-Rhodomonas_salina.1
MDPEGRISISLGDLSHSGIDTRTVSPCSTQYAVEQVQLATKKEVSETLMTLLTQDSLNNNDDFVGETVDTATAGVAGALGAEQATMHGRSLYNAFSGVVPEISFGGTDAVDNQEFKFEFGFEDGDVKRTDGTGEVGQTGTGEGAGTTDGNVDGNTGQSGGTGGDAGTDGNVDGNTAQNGGDDVDVEPNRQLVKSITIGDQTAEFDE